MRQSPLSSSCKTSCTCAVLAASHRSKQRFRLVICRAAHAPQNVLLLGNGAREHALAWKLAQSKLCKNLYCAPGNAGISQEANVQLSSVSADDPGAVVSWCRDNEIGLVMVGPEAPLVAGITDVLQAAGIRVFGPSAAAAQLEGSKAFLKKLCEDHDIPTARYQTFDDAQAARAYLHKHGAPAVIKANGLAAGKGVYVAHSLEEALTAVDDLLVHQKFGKAGHEIIIEDFLDGEEASFFALIDGRTCIPLASAQDHKAVGEGDTGPNTGGMGAYSPAPVITPQLHDQIMQNIVQRTASAMVDQSTSFTGILFAGVMIKDGKAKLLEHNVRFGDPECQCLMMRLESDLLELILNACEHQLDNVQLQWSLKAALTVVMAAKGYPGDYSKGSVIDGLEDISGAKVFHAGTKQGSGGELLADGGRVLSVCALGDSIQDAHNAAYKAVDQVQWQDGFCRRDIGWRALKV